MEGVKELRQRGFTVKARHNRNFKLIPKLNGFAPALSSKGGFTEVNIYKDEDLLASGWSACCGVDNYNRKLGVKIAINRALHSIAAS